MNFAVFLGKRLFQALFVVLIVGLISFTLFQYIGDPLSVLTSVEMTVEQREKLRDDLGLNDPAVVQYATYLVNALKGEWGVSFFYKTEVFSLIADRLPATIELTFIAMLIALAIGIPIGIYTTLHNNTKRSSALMLLSLVGMSTPTFVTGACLILVFAVVIPLVPSFGRGAVVDLVFWKTGLLSLSGLRSLILPALTLGFFQSGIIVRLTRSEAMEVLQKDYILFARARGIPQKIIHRRYILKNTLIPLINVLGVQFGGLLAFSVVTESVFQWPGLGLLFIEAVQNVDIPIMSTYLMLIAFFFVIVTLVVDVASYFVDPRFSAKMFQTKS